MKVSVNWETMYCVLLCNWQLSNENRWREFEWEEPHRTSASHDASSVGGLVQCKYSKWSKFLSSHIWANRKALKIYTYTSTLISPENIPYMYMYTVGTCTAHTLQFLSILLQGNRKPRHIPHFPPKSVLIWSPVHTVRDTLGRCRGLTWSHCG